MNNAAFVALLALSGCATAPVGAIYPCAHPPRGAVECYDKYGRILSVQHIRAALKQGDRG
jgi:hypothetical protein